MSKQLSVRINRRRWLRGTGSGWLWHSGKRAGCCLGHAVKQLNKCTWKDLDGEMIPSRRDIPGCETLRQFDEIAYINDDRALSDKKRESRLRALFKEYLNIQLSFFN